MGQTTKMSNSCVCDEQLVPSYAPGRLSHKKQGSARNILAGTEKERPTGGFLP